MSFLVFYVCPTKAIHMLHISIQLNGKTNVGVQNVTEVIVYGANCAFEQFRVQSVIWSIV